MVLSIGLPFIDKKLIVELLRIIDVEILASHPTSRTDSPCVHRVMDEDTGMQIVYSHGWDISTHALKRQIKITWEETNS